MKRRRSLTASLAGIILVAVVAIGATLIIGRAPLLGLDLRGGVEVVLSPQGHPTDATLNQAVNIIDRRVNGLGVANSTVQRQGRDLVVELPGIKNQTSALKAIGQTAQLFFRPVTCFAPAYAKPTTTTTTPGSSRSTTKTSTPKTANTTAATAGTGHESIMLASSTSPTTTPASPSTTAPSTTTAPSKDKTAALATKACSSASAASIPNTNPDSDYQHNTVILPAAPGSGASGTSNGRWVLGPADTTGKIIASAQAQQSTSNSGQYSVEAKLTGTGNTEFNKIAAVRNAVRVQSPNSYGAREAIELDGQVESVPTIDNASFAGSVQITGSFTQSQATNLALELNYGSLPVRFNKSSVSTVSATLGHASLRAGLLAGLGGVVLVLLYMIAYYRALGLVVVLGLLVGGSLLYAILTELSYTASLALTLSGVTGIIVSIGITVDSYVVYFERLKDEVRKGQTIRSSVERGFSRAFRTVLTADLVSFMAALILYLFTVGDVKGFAFTLGLSTLLDVFTAYFFIRPIVILLGRRRTTSETRFLGIARGLGAPSTSGV